MATRTPSLLKDSSVAISNAFMAMVDLLPWSAARPRTGGVEWGPEDLSPLVGGVRRDGHGCADRAGSREDLANQGAGDGGQAEAPAVVSVSKPLVVEAEEVEDGGMEVVDMHAVDGGGVADLVRLAVTRASLDSAAGHPEGEPVGVVIAARLLAGLRDR